MHDDRSVNELGMRRLMPGVPDVVFFLVLLSALIGGRFRLLNDPGTPWHAQLGRDIATAGAVPRFDALTYTHDHSRWVDQSWLFDLGLARLVGWGGWSAAVLAAALLLALLYAFVARGLLSEGRTPLVALVTAVLVAGIGSIHFLVRPHLMTLVLFWATLRLCRLQHVRGGWWIAWTPVLTALWANLHGGFLAAPVVVFSAAVGHAVSGSWDADRRREVAKFVAFGVVCVLAALINPYGVGLYRHVGVLLLSGVTEVIDEYQPIPFGKPDARVFEWVLLALVALPTVAKARMSRYELVHSLVWLHLSLASVRHAPLFGLAVASGLARVLDGVVASTRIESEPLAAEASRDLSWSFWPAVAAVGLWVALLGGAVFGRFDPDHWPLSALPSLNRQPSDARLFHDQEWGGLVASECRPPRRSFIDDRFELFGKEEVLRYLNAMQGGPDWDLLRDRYGISLVWVRPASGLTRRLRQDPAWKVVHSDEVSVLFAAANGTGPGPEVAGR
jgi:hypothetical protein